MTPVPARSRRHPITARILARRMAAVGWTDAAIVRELHRQGHLVKPATVAEWVRPDEAGRKAAAQRHRSNTIRSRQRGAAGGLIPLSARPEYLDARITALATFGLTDAQIAAVMTFDLRSGSISTGQVTELLDGPGPRPKTEPPPRQADPQRAAALRRGNRIRLEGAAIKADLAAGRVSFTDALIDARARRVSLRALLIAQPRWGTARSDRALSAARLTGSERAEDLTVGQRLRIAAAVVPVAGENVAA